MAAGGAREARAAAVWFRCDLRVDDHPALAAAARGAAALLPVYVFDPTRLGSRAALGGARKCGARRARFAVESVAALRRALEARGSGLAVGTGRPADVLRRLCGGCGAVYITETVCSEEHGDEAAVAAALRPAPLRRVWGGTLYNPDELGMDPRQVPLQFTAFKNKAEGRGRVRPPLDPPASLPGLPGLSEDARAALRFLPTLEELGYTAEEAAAARADDPRAVLEFRGGEPAALARLQSWMWDDDRLREYFDIRNGMVGGGYSSKLSPWLALGCVSPRRVAAEVRRYEQQRVKNKSTYWLIFELTWRDFFVYMARAQGDRIFTPGGVSGQARRWSGGAAELARWKAGRTGKPLVDANMRELAATGFMSNRGRQNVASYLIFDLGVDWRYGAAHFEEHLLDYDPASNWGNWVAAAGLTGGRVNRFNVDKQARDYDPGGAHARLWLGAAPSRAPAQTQLVFDKQGGDVQAVVAGGGRGGGGGGGGGYGRGGRKKTRVRLA